MPDEFKFTISGQGRIEDDEEEEEKRPGRPNAWWAEHKNDVADATERAATFDSAVRGVSQGPHGGQASVRPEDTTGSLTYCWCGLPFDHDWPGKDKGRKHPREEASMSAAAAASQQQHIDRRQLRAYNDDLVDVIVEAVNGYGARYRMQNNGVVLFPPDGSQGITVNARAGAKQVKSARLWFLRHCVGVGDDGKPLNPLVEDPAVLTDDADRRSDRVRQEARDQTREEVHEDLQRLSDSVTELPAADDEEPWVPYVDTSGNTNEYFETNGTVYRCKVCLGTETAYESENSRGIGGHIRMNHRGTEDLHSPEAREKATESKRLNRMTRQVEQAVGLLNGALGVTQDTRQIEALKAENVALTKRAEEAETRLALMREALQA